MGGVIFQSTFIPSTGKVAVARSDRFALAIAAAACAAIALGACVGAIGLGAIIAAATVDCYDCAVREDGPDNLERSHVLQSENRRYRSG
jgi:hypothetical protein